MFITSSNTSSKANLRRLFILRNIGIVGQSLAILVAVQWLDISLPLLPLGFIIASLAGWNLLTWHRLHREEEVSDREFLVQLGFDVLALTGVLYYCGGATNPFTWVYLLPVIISATMLPKSFAWGMATLTICCYSLLVKFYVPLHQPEMSHMSHSAHMSHDDTFNQHVLGMWFGFVLSAAMVAYFISGMANSLRERDRVLARAREQALRDERLVALGTLAAGAAHELGTPLGTMAIVAGELERQYPEEKDPALHGQLNIIKQQLARCKQALSVISASAGEVRAEAGHLEPVQSYLEQFIGKWQQHKPEAHLEYKFEGSETTRHVIADHVLQQSLCNILDNAAEASPEHVELLAQWDEQELLIEINDRGPGLSEEASGALGKSLFTTKQHGMGVGLFLAHAAIERLGGNVMLSNRQGGGVCTRIMLPLFDLATNHHIETVNP